MTELEITNRLVAAHTAIVAKIGKQPLLAPYLVFHGTGRVDCNCYTVGADCTRFFGDTIAECLDGLDAFVAAMPSPEKARLHNHMRRVATCIDEGREDGIDDAYIAPLVVVKAAMTENLLAKE